MPSHCIWPGGGGDCLGKEGMCTLEAGPAHADFRGLEAFPTSITFPPLGIVFALKRALRGYPFLVWARIRAPPLGRWGVGTLNTTS